MTATAINAPAVKGTAGATFKKNKGASALLTTATWIIGLIFIAPVFFMILTSFHPEVSAGLNPPQLFAPLTLHATANSSVPARVRVRGLSFSTR